MHAKLALSPGCTTSPLARTVQAQPVVSARARFVIQRRVASARATGPGNVFPLFDLSEAQAAAAAVVSTASNKDGFLSPLVNSLEFVLKYLQDGLETLHVPYSYGTSIILLTMLVKLATFPLTKQQVESSMAVQALKPRIDLIKQRYGEDKDKIQKETSVLYEQAGVNPLAGCVPTLATIPIFIGLYRSLTNVAQEGLLSESFYWVPSLAGPISMADQKAGLGMSWLLPFVDGAPPIGWEDALAYLSLPVMLVGVQYLSNAIVSPPIDPNDPNANTTRALYTFLPLMIGWFSLNVPAGLSLYYLSNSVLMMLTQVYLKKLGGAQVKMRDLGPVTKPGSGRRTGDPVEGFQMWVPPSYLEAQAAAKAAAEAEAAAEEGTGASSEATALARSAVQAELQPGSGAVDKRVKRRKLSTLVTSTA